MIKILELSKPEKLSFTIPFIVENNLSTSVVINIPRSFRLYASDKHIAEYITQDAKSGYESKRSIIVFVNGDTDPYKLIKEYQNNIINHFKDVKIIFQDDKIVDNYKISTLIISSDLNGRKEIHFGKYYFGGFDIVGFYYSIVLDDNMTQELALKEINEFVDNPRYVKVIQAIHKSKSN